MQEFAIKHAVVWRGWCEHDVASSEFIWKSQSGHSVATAVLPWGYGCAKWLPDNPEKPLPFYLLSWKNKPVLLTQTKYYYLMVMTNPLEYAVPAMLEQLNKAQKEYYFVKVVSVHF